MKLIRTFHNYTLTNKVKKISAILIFFTAIVLFLQSGLLEQGTNLIHNRDIAISSFLYDGLNIIKIIAVLYSMLLCIYVFHLNRFDVFLVVRKSRFKVILSKVVVVIFLESLFVVYLLTIYVIIWGLLDYEVTFEMVFSHLSYLLVLSTYYTLLNIILMMVFSNIFIIIIPFIGYLISNFSIDYGISVNELTKDSKIINLFFPDLLLYKREIYFVYSMWFVIDISIIILVFIIIKYKVDDVII